MVKAKKAKKASAARGEGKTRSARSAASTKRTAAKTPSAAPSSAKSAEPTDVVGPPPKYTWEALRKHIGDPTDEERRIFAEPIAVAELVRDGASVRSERILTDGLRWLGLLWVYWSKLTPEEKQRVRGFSDGRLRVSLAHFLALRQALERNRAVASRAASHARAVAEAEERYRRGQWTRRQLTVALGESFSGHPALAAALAAADAKAKDAKQLSKTLRDLVAIGRSALASDPVLAEALRADGVDDAYLSSIEQLSADLEVDAGDRGVAGEAPVSQSEIDRLDGLCLAAMRRMRRVFALHKKVDPRVPALAAIATRTVFGGRTAQSAARKDEQEDERDDEA